MKFITTFALLVTTITIASKFDVVASSASVLDEVDPPQTRNTKVKYSKKDDSTSSGVKEEKELLSPFVMMTTAAAVAADSSNSTLATKHEERVTATTTTTPEGFAASSLSSSSSLSLPSTLLEVSGADGDDVSAQRKLSKSSKKVKHPKALCTLSLFADSVFMYENQCFSDIMLTISPCEDTDGTCYISERLPLLSQEENQEEEQCFVGGLFPAKQNIRYNPSTGDCEFLYVDLTDDACNMYTDDDGAGSLGLKARINVKTNLDVMFIQFTKDLGLSFYNFGEERVAVRSTSPKNRYLHQEGETKPLLSMGPHPHRRRRRRMTDCKALEDCAQNCKDKCEDYFGGEYVCESDCQFGKCQFECCVV